MAETAGTTELGSGTCTKGANDGLYDPNKGSRSRRSGLCCTPPQLTAGSLTFISHKGDRSVTSNLEGEQSWSWGTIEKHLRTSIWLPFKHRQWTMKNEKKGECKQNVSFVKWNGSCNERKTIKLTDLYYLTVPPTSLTHRESQLVADHGWPDEEWEESKQDSRNEM